MSQTKTQWVVVGQPQFQIIETVSEVGFQFSFCRESSYQGPRFVYDTARLQWSEQSFGTTEAILKEKERGEQSSAEDKRRATGHVGK